MQKNGKNSKTSKNSVYLGTLERFGYDLVCVGATKKEVVGAIMANYDETYQKENGCDPRTEHTYDFGFSDYEMAKGDIYVRKMKYGQVEWC